MSDEKKYSLLMIVRWLIVFLSAMLVYTMFYRKTNKEQEISENFEESELTWDQSIKLSNKARNLFIQYLLFSILVMVFIMIYQWHSGLIKPMSISGDDKRNQECVSLALQMRTITVTQMTYTLNIVVLNINNNAFLVIHTLIVLF